jgi:hypothetical protein
MINTFLKFLAVGVMIWILAGFVNNQTSFSLINPSGTKISERFPAPSGFLRVAQKTGSFPEFLEALTLKPHGTLVHYYNGEEKPSRVAAAVLTTDVGTRDLQQCADAVMRLRAEYLFQTKQYEALHFNFTNGFKADYTK